MVITASLYNSQQQNEVVLATDGKTQELSIAAKVNGQGSVVNGGELLMLALATCCCNDLYREASRRSIMLDSVYVKASANFAGERAPATGIHYEVSVKSDAPRELINALIQDTDGIAEIHKTLRQ